MGEMGTLQERETRYRGKNSQCGISLRLLHSLGTLLTQSSPRTACARDGVLRLPDSQVNPLIMSPAFDGLRYHAITPHAAHLSVPF